jgi:hypothetical protein
MKMFVLLRFGLKSAGLPYATIWPDSDLKDRHLPYHAVASSNFVNGALLLVGYYLKPGPHLLIYRL